MGTKRIPSFMAIVLVCGVLLAAQGVRVSAQVTAQGKAQVTAQPNLSAALLAAAEKGDAGAVGALLRKKADVEARDARGFTPLAIAASLGHTAVVELLLKAGADPDAQTRSGSTPLLFAAFGGHTQTIAALLRARARLNHRTPDGITALMMAANAGHAARITQLVEAGAEVDAADGAGRTALMLAAAKGHVAAVQALVKAGADVHLANQWGDTALTWAGNEGHTAAVEALLAAGARVEAKNKVGATALLLAARGGFADMLAPLLAAGARTDATDENGRSALMFAAFNGHTDVVKALLAAKAAPNAADHKGQTALMHAATQGHAAAVAALLEAGADANATTSNGSTALMSAAFWGRRAAVAALLAAGADPTLKDSAGKTAADLAREAGHTDLLPLFAEHVAQAGKGVTRKDPAPTPSPEAGASGLGTKATPSGLGAKPTRTAEAAGSKPTPTPGTPGAKRTPTPEAPASGFSASASAGVPAKSIPRFEDVTTQAGIHFTHTNGATAEKYMPETMGSGGLFFDFDNDGWLDIFLVNGGSIADPEISKRARYPLYRNNRDGTFTDLTARSGITPLRYGMGACAADYDNDGWTDLYITGFQGNALYRNTGKGSFTDVTAKARAAVNSWSTSCAWADFDKDGHLDLYIVNYVDFSLTKNLFCGDPVQRVRAYCHPHAYTGLDDVLLRNNGDGTFTDISKQAGISGVAGPRTAKGLGVVVGDYDNDGWPDIYVANDSVPNFLWRNRGPGTAGILPALHEGQRNPGDTATAGAVPARSRQDAGGTITFEDVAQWAGVAVSGQGRPEAGMGTDIADFDNDGLLDLFVTNLDLETVTFYRNLGKGMFTDATDELGLGAPSSPYVGWGTAFFDFDNDGRLDIAVANGNVLDNASFFREAATYAQPKLLFHNDGARFTEVGAAAGPGFALVKVGRGLAAGDFDNDGDLDLLITNNGQFADLLRNDGGNRSNSLLICLIGQKSNRDGVGARVTLTIGDTRQLREVKAGSSYLAQNDPRVHFGLGNATRIDRLEIRWPSGAVETFEKLDPNQILTVVEGKGITARTPLRPQPSR